MCCMYVTDADQHLTPPTLIKSQGFVCLQTGLPIIHLPLSNFEQRSLPSPAQRALVSLARPLDVRDAAQVASRHEPVVQRLDVRKHQQRRHALVLDVQRRRQPHERAPAVRKRHARRAHVPLSSLARCGRQLLRRRGCAHAVGRVARDKGAEACERLV